MKEGIKFFYITTEGKEKKWNPSKEELTQYKEICFTIWGAAPFDVTWAIETGIYKQELLRRLNHAQTR